MSTDASWESCLSNELWARIFSTLAEEVFDKLQNMTRSLEHGADIVDNHAKYHSLRLVCRRFQAVFLSHPNLSGDLFLHLEPSQAATLSMLEWLQRDGVTIRRLIAECSSTSLAAALAGAVTAAGRPLQKLTFAIVQDCSIVSLSLLSTCTALETCQFLNTSCQLDLAALEALPRLSFLRLEGHKHFATFLGLERLAHLTRVEVLDTVVNMNQPCLFLSCLQDLSLVDVVFHFSPQDGLFLCTALQSLSLLECCISCSAAEHTVDIVDTPAKLPGSLSSLTQLTKLELHVCSVIDGVLECTWLSKLTALKQLALTFVDGTMRFNLTDQLLSMTNLQVLRINQQFQPDSPETVLSLEVSWHRLPMLQTVSLFGRFLKFDHRVLGLIKLSALRTLEFHCGRPSDDQTAYHFGILMYNMAVERPDVVCRLGLQFNRVTPQSAFARFEQAL